MLTLSHSQGHLHDMHAEGVTFIEALHAFEEQTVEVLGILGDLLRSRKHKESEVTELEWKED